MTTDEPVEGRPETIRAPWTQDQVARLNAHQTSGRWHGFTCAVHSNSRSLVATVDGWRCPAPGCDYQQDWALAMMAETDDPPSPSVPVESREQPDDDWDGSLTPPPRRNVQRATYVKAELWEQACAERDGLREQVERAAQTFGSEDMWLAVQEYFEPDSPWCDPHKGLRAAGAIFAEWTRRDLP